jgi:hypothetical protein
LNARLKAASERYPKRPATLGDAGAGLAERGLREVHAQPRDVAHRRLGYELREARRERGARHRDLVREGPERPGASGCRWTSAIARPTCGSAQRAQPARGPAVVGAAGVRRLVLLSGRGEEAALQGEQPCVSPVEWTILRAAWFSQNFSRGVLR